MNDPIPFPPRLPPGPKNARMTACEVLTWIALGRAQTIEQVQQSDLRVHWDTSRLDLVQAALEARLGIGEPDVVGPFCLFEPPNEIGGHAGVYVTKSGPLRLRHMRARFRRERGYLVSYADLLGEVIDRIKCIGREAEWDKRATWELLEALRANRIVATGKPRYPNGERNFQSAIEDIGDKVFHDPAFTIDHWGNVMADLYAAGVAVPYQHGTTFSDVSFDTETVLELWPVEQVAAGKPGSSRPPQSRVDETMLRHAKAAAAAGCKTTQEEAEKACAVLIPPPTIGQMRAAWGPIPAELKRTRGEKKRS